MAQPEKNMAEGQQGPEAPKAPKLVIANKNGIEIGEYKPWENLSSSTPASTEPAAAGTPGGPEEHIVSEFQERLTSPERGRRIVQEIIGLEAERSYTDRYKVKDGPLSNTNPEIYNERNGTYLDQLYKDLQAFVGEVCKERNDKNPWSPDKEYKAPSQPSVNQEAQAATEDLTGLRSIAELTAWYQNRNISGSDHFKIQGQLQVYFKEAKRKGLLEGVDAVLASIAESIQDNPPNQARLILDRNIASAISAAEATFRSRRQDPEVARLAGVWDAYILWAKERFELALAGQKQPDNREGEFLFAQDSVAEERETYWQPSTYPDYYIVTATTPEQFQRAKESFLQMIKGGSLGRSPDKILPHLENFAKALGQRGLIQELAGTVEHGFMEELRQEFEGLSYVDGADYSNESYNPDNYYKFMMALALHEGPQRWVRLARSGKGQVGAFLWKFDNDPRIALFYNSGGSRGQIANDTVTQNYLQTEIQQILIEESMGIQLKDYDSRDQTLNSQPQARQARLARAKDLARIEAELKRVKKIDKLSKRDQTVYKAALEALKANLNRIGVHQPDEDFKGLYEGFDQGNTHIENYKAFKDQGGTDQTIDELQSKSLRESVNLGRIQKDLARIREDIKAGKKELKPGKKAIDLLSEKDKVVYKAAYDQAEANFKVAYQMVGATGEKVRRGGGVFYVDRNIVNGKPEFVDHMPIYLAIKFVQYAETRTKIQYSDESGIWDQLGFNTNGFIEIEKDGKKVRLTTKAAYRTYAVERARKGAIAEIKTNGFEAKLVLPKVNFDEEGNVVGAGENEIVELDQAVKHIYSRWTSHTYWGYQQENRHMLLAPHILEAAKRIRSGKKGPEEEDMLATQLLIVDPTLKRVKRLPGDQMGKEVMLLEAAVEESNQGHWRIDSELHEAFLPGDGNANEIRVGYNREDFGGVSRHIIAVKEYVAAHSKRFSRRFAAELAHSPMHISSMPDIWGQEGVLGAISMFADPIGKIADQRAASQFAITKFVNQMRYGWMMFGALYGYEDSEKGVSVEGLYEKPTNNSDKLAGYYEHLQKADKYYDAEDAFFYALMETFGRLDRVVKLMRVMESDVRNAQGALLTEKQEVFSPDGSFNRVLAAEGERYTGSGRHSERIFFDHFVNWLMDEGPGGGAKAYPSETRFYKHLDDQFWYFDKDGNKKMDTKGDGSKRTWRDWLFDKMCR